MKLYTLEYDCNNPVVQQINVPTNTDYKLGIKVKRNGAYQNLKPAEVTLGALSADEDDVNGYTTFTLSAGDNASYTQEVLDIKHAQDAALEKSYVYNDTGATMNEAYPMEGYSVSALAGKTITPYTFSIYAKTNLSALPTDSELVALVEPYATTNLVGLNMKTIISGDQGVIYSFTGATRNMYLQSFIDAGAWKAEDGVPFFFAPTGSQTFSPIKEYTFDGSETLSYGKYKLMAGKYVVAANFFAFDEPFDAKFKLNINEFKSQQGDIGELGKMANTVSIAGTLSDSTPFDYNVVIK